MASINLIPKEIFFKLLYSSMGRNVYSFISLFVSLYLFHRFTLFPINFFIASCIKFHVFSYLWDSNVIKAYNIWQFLRLLNSCAKRDCRQSCILKLSPPIQLRLPSNHANIHRRVTYHNCCLSRMPLTTEWTANLMHSQRGNNCQPRRTGDKRHINYGYKRFNTEKYIIKFAQVDCSIVAWKNAVWDIA